MGLLSISYSHTWYTIANNSNKENHFYFNYGQRRGFFFTAIVQEGYYDSANEFIEAVNQSLRKGNCPPEKINLTYDSTTRKVTFHLANNCLLGFNTKLSHILGLKEEENFIRQTMESPYVVDLALTSSIYVYCDIAEPQIVGNTNAKLLRTIPVQGKLGDDVYMSFTNILHVGVQLKSFEDIQVLLRTDTGNPVPFERGNVVITLHFRKHTYFT